MRTLLIGIVGMLALTSTNCIAVTLEEARSARQVCEGTDGELHDISGGIDEIIVLIGTINAQRKAEYVRIDLENNAKEGTARATAAKQLRNTYLPCN